MTKAILDLVNGFREKLDQVSEMVSSIQTKDLRAVQHLMKWLLAVEELMKKNNLPQGAEIAALRARLLAPSFKSVTKNRRREEMFAALEIIPIAQQVVQEKLQPLMEKVEQGRNVLRQAIGLAVGIGLIGSMPDNPEEFSNWVMKTWSNIRDNKQLGVAISSTSSQMGYADTYRLFAEELLEYFSENRPAA